MISLYSLTEDSISAFLPLLSESAKAALYDDDGSMNVQKGDGALQGAV